jgi:DNA polymerase III subunit gamma/tau
VLSQFPVGGGSKPGPGVAPARASSPAMRAPTRTPVSAGATARVLETGAAVSAQPAFSPFEKDQSRRRFDEKAVVAASRPLAMPMPVPASIAVPAPVAMPAEMVLTDGDAIGAALLEVGDLAEAAVVAQPVVEERSEPAGEKTEALHDSDVQPLSLHSAESLQKASIDALVRAKNQDTAADALGDAEWLVTGGEVRVQTELSKTMLPMVINAETEKLIKAALQKAGAGTLKLVMLPGVKTATAAKKPRAAKAGSVQAMAMEHPIVQRAQTLFNAEIQSVIDLRENE